ncbi:hypothetical protein KAFR_0D02570 [Kazachstania africana CBS 2517]|uniref:Ribosomal protein bL31m N-terminal domain-containing protein n=1 Tax=Kazachstania africana (strain ATCC 22294 / BCRC 22015 / CBS 2517 / CECT 1963 / NBRC 1671 / NRRL Y-8276) TaxID=1071382 RepID=H2AU54_KAZAF|nr:hypothetical protein KAFR_0D02570 [Kazachstania africana CBS 2517]CCF57904.1 hypothetical protein KAFR_0D02570 [Kazachstania africana CBS 2517]
MKSIIDNIPKILKRCAGSYPGSMRTSLPRRPVKKIRLGKARPAIYHQFDVAVELSDGSVIMRRSQLPKAEMRLIQDQRNNPLWNPSRKDMVATDADAAGSIDKFRQKYGDMFSTEPRRNEQVKERTAGSVTNDTATTEPPVEDEEIVETEQESGFDMGDYISLLDDSSQQIKSGKIASKKRDKKK